MKQKEHITEFFTGDILLTVPIKIIYELLIKSTEKIKIATAFKGSLGFVFTEEDGTILLT